jgi:hypothetical protein
MPVKYTSYMKEVNAKIDKGIFRGLSAVGAFVENRAVTIISENPNVDSGRLRGSITYNVNGSGDRVKSPAKGSDAVEKSTSPYTVNVGSNVEYAARIEFIGGKGKNVGYLRPAVDKSRKSIERILQGELRKI